MPQLWPAKPILCFTDAGLERAFQTSHTKQMARLDGLVVCLLIPLDIHTWLHLLSNQAEAWRYTGNVLITITVTLMRYHIFTRQPSYEARRSVLLSVCKVSSVVKTLFLHKCAMRKPKTGEELGEPTVWMCGCWPIMVATSFFFRQGIGLHLPIQVAMLTWYLCCNAWLLRELQEDHLYRPALEEYDKIVGGYARFLPPPWPGFEDTPDNRAAKVWAAAQLVLGTLVPSYFLYFLERRNRHDFAKRYRPPGLPTQPSLRPSELLHDNMHLVCLQLLLMAAVFVCIWYKPFLALLLV